MKKFLSLALALVMSLSLLTVASAAEYKDLTDKSEITYSEAVAVLNKLGIISGYEDGSFKPETALNRAQAAKIICGLLLTQSTADKLTVSSAPYKDVAADYWAAAYISYCKNAGIIDGYSDGTFRPTETLTGYQFGKMLLTALGYDAKTEGFVGRGWTLNVAKVGQAIGLFNGNDAFGGNSEVTREEACLYALNMLKSTEVTYSGTNISVSTGDAQVTINNSKAYAVDRLNETPTNAWNGIVDNDMQFVEEHFPALKMTNAGAHDSFGRPAISWSYKNVTFGTFAKQPKFTFTAAASGDTAADKVKNMGLKDYSVAATAIIVDGDAAAGDVSLVAAQGQTALTDADKLALIAGQTGNGVVVEVYTSDTTADQITDVVVMHPQLMQINKVNKVGKVVSLKQVGSIGSSVSSVKDGDDCYAELATMAADDYVVVTPCNGAVSSIYVPTTDSGILTKVSMAKQSDGSYAPNGVTVNGTAYKLAALRDGFASLAAASTNGKQDSTVYVDKYGYAMYIKDTAAATNYIIFSSVYNSLVDGKIVATATGYDLEGNAISLNLGTTLSDDNNGSLTCGTVYTYTDSNVAYDAEYRIVAVSPAVKGTSGGSVSAAAISAGAASMGTWDGTNKVYFASGVKFVYLTFNTDAAGNKTSIKSVTVKDGVQEITSGNVAKAQPLANKDGYITNVVMGVEADTATGADVAFVSAKTGETKVGTKAAYVYTLYIDGAKVENVVSTTSNLVGSFVTYADNGDDTYTLKAYVDTGKTTSVKTGVTVSSIEDNRYMTTSGGLNDLGVKDAVIVDVADEGIGSVSDIKDLLATKTVTVAVVYNDNSNSDGYNTASYIFVTDVQ